MKKIDFHFAVSRKLLVGKQKNFGIQYFIMIWIHCPNLKKIGDLPAPNIWRIGVDWPHNTTVKFFDSEKLLQLRKEGNDIALCKHFLHKLFSIWICDPTKGWVAWI
jgi:hypothetical protein